MGPFEAIAGLLRESDCLSRGQIRLRSIRAALTLRSSVPERGSALRTIFFVRPKRPLPFSLGTDARDRRAFELINKTNQFNLNGRRFSESEWLSFIQDPAAFLLTASYEDKYGPLGKIAVSWGESDGHKLYVSPG